MIVTITDETIKHFDEVRIGDCFTKNSSATLAVYIKVMPYFYDDKMCNAVNLVTGSHNHVNDFEEVEIYTDLEVKR